MPVLTQVPRGEDLIQGGVCSRPWIEWFNEIRNIINGIGPPGSGTVTSVGAVAPLSTTPTNPFTTAGQVIHLPSGVVAGTYGDATHVAQITVEADGHSTTISNVAITGAGGGGNSFFWALVLGGN